jgi:hypothetical protein
MKMTYLASSLLVSAGLVVACVDAPPTLQVRSAFAPDEECVISNDEEAAILRGSLNVGTRGFGGYPVGFTVTSNQAATEIVVSEQPVSGNEQLNALYLTGLRLTYSATPAVGDITGGVVPIHGTIDEDGLLAVDLLTGQASAALINGIAAVNYLADGGMSVSDPNKPTGVELGIRVQFLGETSAGDELESNEITFPIAVNNVPLPSLQQLVCGQRGRFPVAALGSCRTGLNGFVPPCEPIPDAGTPDGGSDADAGL